MAGFEVIIEALVSDLRDFAKPNSSRMEPFDLSETVQTTLRLTESTLRESDIDVVSDIESDLPPAFGDQSSLNQVVLNVVKNSMDALEPQSDGKIIVSIRVLRDRGY